MENINENVQQDYTPDAAEYGYYDPYALPTYEIDQFGRGMGGFNRGFGGFDRGFDGRGRFGFRPFSPFFFPFFYPPFFFFPFGRRRWY